MDDRSFRRAGAIGALGLAVSSVLYAVAFLIITPADQRSEDAAKFLRSFAEDPGGRQFANVCFVIAGVAGTFAVIALAERLRSTSSLWATWATVVGVVANLAGAAHGLWNISRLHELSSLYATAENRVAVEVVYAQPSPVDPLAMFRFAVAGGVAVVLGLLILHTPPLPRPLGWLAVALGVDTVILFAASWAGASALVLVSGGVASLALLPAFWIWAGAILWRECEAPRPLAAPSAIPAS